MAFSPRLISQRSALPTITISWSDERLIDRGIPDHHIENLKLVPARQNDRESDRKRGTPVDRLKENQYSDRGRMPRAAVRRRAITEVVRSSQKDQPVRLKPHDTLARQGIFLARLLYVAPIMLAGPQSFF